MPLPLVGPAPRTTPADLRALGRRDLPADLQRNASRRLGASALLGAALWTIAPLLGHFVGASAHAPGGGARFGISDGIAAASVLISIGVFLYSRGDRDPRIVLDVGLGYMVCIAFALGQMFHSDIFVPTTRVEPQISWIGAVVLMFAAIVPSTPGKMFLAGLVAASMNPVGMLIARARGHWDFGPTSNVLVMHWPDYILVGCATVISHVVTGLGREVAKAREMGSYRLGELLGKGGMGEVYKATHRMLARPAAIKLIRPEMLGGDNALAAQIATRFRREAEAAANLRSPHTVELYDFGVAEDGTLYFVMELLEGFDLEKLVREKGPVPAARAIYIVRQVCESLEEAHARGLVHRDIKPANIHVGRLGLEHDFVKVLDFGLVKSVEPQPGGDTLDTAAGATPGTPAYLAPEAAEGGTVDGRADLYALGCVLYYLLTGHLVFEANSAISMMTKHLHDQPIPPSKRTELAVPPELDRVVLDCLAKNPDERPQSAAELSRRLAAVDAGEWSDEKARGWWQIHQPGG